MTFLHKAIPHLKYSHRSHFTPDADMWRWKDKPETSCAISTIMSLPHIYFIILKKSPTCGSNCPESESAIHVSRLEITSICISSDCTVDRNRVQHRQSAHHQPRLSLSCFYVDFCVGFHLYSRTAAATSLQTQAERHTQRVCVPSCWALEQK